MELGAATRPAAERPAPVAPRPGFARRGGGLAVLLVLLALVSLLSIAIGSKSIPLGTVLHELVHFDGSDDGLIIRSLRIPRTVLGLAVGAALGLAGALMQALTRNPLADPGLLGVNAGAAAAVVVGITVLGITRPSAYVWLAFAGAALTSVLVYLVGSQGRSGRTPVQLALAGAAVTAVLSAVTSGLTLTDQAAFDSYRFWSVGALGGRPLSVLTQLSPFLIVGIVLALALARPLNALALGDETGRALGARVGRTRLLGALAITVLCGAATAAAGPIAFVGLAVAHVARAITGPDQRWVLPYSMVLAPSLLLGADVLGRVIARPGEIQVGIVTAFLGAPALIVLARRRRIAVL
jgi:iron complex transport system permease protein